MTFSDAFHEQCGYHIYIIVSSNAFSVLYASRDNAVEDDKKELILNGLDSVINYELSNVASNNEICHKSEHTIAQCVHEILSDVVLFHENNEIPAMWEVCSESC